MKSIIIGPHTSTNIYLHTHTVTRTLEGRGIIVIRNYFLLLECIIYHSIFRATREWPVVVAGSRGEEGAGRSESGAGRGGAG